MRLYAHGRRPVDRKGLRLTKYLCNKEIIMANAESGRWYDPTTRKCVTEITGKNGKARKPNIADAAKLGLLPSVTTTFQVLAKPGLTTWFNKCLIEACLTLPKKDDESLDAFAIRVQADAETIAQNACATGKDFHTAAENYWKAGTLVTGDEAMDKFVAELAVWRKGIEAKFKNVRWIAEAPYIHPILGIAGTPDLVGVSDDLLIVADYKTMNFKGDKPIEPYPEHGMQIAAGISALLPEYGLTKALGVEIYVDRVSGQTKFHEWLPGDIERSLDMLTHTSELWKLLNKWTERQAKHG
jgi:hypothetical protein